MTHAGAGGAECHIGRCLLVTLPAVLSGCQTRVTFSFASANYQ